ncbi:asparaginase domain-containing protein [Streptomyces sp. TLI_146]|uniref:asparaginase domain-containing protein n=1 Tax=Streptomyces sp. TLI_146 TaxID=1938858 RepID=UPI00214CBA2D|nr:asparaginase domain-containing protein [Streptomyces sp. TLI_146]
MTVSVRNVAAFFLDLYHDHPQPMIVTGAMRNPTLPGADGPANIHSAVLAAADPAPHGAGCLVVLGDDGVLLDVWVGHCDGLLVAAFGAGHVPERLVEPLTQLASRIPVVLASRIGNGPLLSRTYSFPGSEKDLLGRGLIGAGGFGPYQARLLLHALLAQGADTAAVRATFEAYAC